MTNLSKELCEICGIEPKQFVKDFKTREKAARFGRKITGIPKYRGNKFDIGSYTDNQSIYQVHWKEFPDFEKPENFVKLFSLITTIEDFTYSTGLYYIRQIPTYKQFSCLATSEGEYESENVNAIKAFLTCVIKCAAEEKDTADYIKETEWMYD